MSIDKFVQDSVATTNSQIPGLTPPAIGASKLQKDAHNKNNEIPDVDEERMLANEALLVCEQGSGEAKIKLAAAHGVNDSAPDAILAHDKIFAPFSLCNSSENTSHICTHPLLTPRWLNTHKKRVINGQESVTTKSFLLCTFQNAIIQPKTDGQVEKKPERKGTLVFFIHGLGAGWTEFDTMISGTSVSHQKKDDTKLSGEQEELKKGFKNKVEGLVKAEGKFKDAGVITRRIERDPIAEPFLLENFEVKENGKTEEDKTAVHNCLPLLTKELYDWLKQDKIVCIKVEFSSGVEHFSKQLSEMTSMVKEVEQVISDAMETDIDNGTGSYFIYDTTFVGHSMGGIASLNYGIDYAKRNPEKMVDIITISTPFYKNSWAKIESDYPAVVGEFILGRSNNGAQDDLAGYSEAMLSLVHKWNQHIVSVEGSNTRLGVIGIKAQSYESTISDLEKKKENGTITGDELIALDTIKPAQKDLEESYPGSDYIVPTEAQLAYPPKSIQKEISEMQQLIKDKGMEQLKKEYRAEIAEAEKALQKTENTIAEYQEKFDNPSTGDDPAWYFNAIETLNVLREGQQRDLERAQGKYNSLSQYVGLVPYQKVKRLKLVTGKGVFVRDTMGVGAMGNPYHHVNTPDIPDVISVVQLTLENGIKDVQEDTKAVSLYGG